MRLPKEVWLIHDPLDGVHVYASRKRAVAVWEKWRREAKDSSYDSWWDMLPPARYVFDKSVTVTSSGKVIGEGAA